MKNQIESSRLIIPNNLEYLPAIQAFAGEVAQALGFQKSQIQMTLLALEEAVVNVVQHAFEEEEKANYEVIFQPTSSGLEIIVKDKGLPFAPNLVPEYMEPTDLDNTVVAGLGSFLMKKSVDEIAFHNLGREGKELHLIKYLPVRNITEYEETSGMTLFTTQPQEKVTPTEKKGFTVRLMDPSESFEVSRLFYRAYGYSYGIDSIYYPDRFEELHRDGSIISVVTITEDNRLVGHFALVKDTPSSRIAEAAMAVVQPELRGQGCQNSMMSRLLEEARRVGLQGVFSKAVTNHVYAQKAGEKAGFKRVAIVAGLIPADRSFKGNLSQLTQRGSVAYGYYTLANPPGIVIYAPSHHRRFIERIYANLGLQRTFAEPDSAGFGGMEGTSDITTTVMPTYNRAIIEVRRFAGDSVSQVKNTLKELRIKKIDQITLYLNLEDPLAALFCEDFEKMGFFIAGILPFSHVGDALLLQYLNNVSIDYSKIMVASESGQEILDYVSSHDPNRG